MAVGHFLRKVGTDTVFPYSKILSERGDMEPISAKEAKALLAKSNSPEAKAKAKQNEDLIEEASNES